MKSKTAYISTLVRFVIFSVAVSGCGSVQMSNPAKRPALRPDAPAGKAHVINVQSLQQGKELVISGKVKRSYSFCCDDVRGHVDIVVVDPEGYVLGATSTFYSPRNIPKARMRSSRFTARLALTLPEGAVIRTAYHDDLQYAAFGGDKHNFQCGLNIAAPGIETAL